MRNDFQVNEEPLPGYRLVGRLGAGGYGEVWRAEAPGGLTKAIKFVFGQQHEKRATRELRALDLIRQLRHPFLLSLERIEVVDDRLMIVTELADGSVKNRFDACRQQGLPGIPRAEMLRYVRDAADALDYMSEQHGLQHLDIKPENLLLLAGHVKVADFGLVKDVRQSGASLVGGMTPLYAAPEVFRGLPGPQSDQYSLAIVYQEMLTGMLPFVGGNAAELTLQHLNDEPELSALSGAERYVVSRALSKDAAHRYATCHEFVEALAQSVSSHGDPHNDGSVTPAPAFSSRFAEPASPRNSPTEFFDDDDATGTRGDTMLMELPPEGRTVVELPPIYVDASSFRPTPALFLGVGGAAGRVLRHLRRSTNELHGDEPIPALQMLLIDTDPQALADVTGINGPGLLLEETLNVPLRRPQHYRERWDQLLSWLSRRWLYNIPKSMRTEGLRPLGRLAFVDHARQVCQRIRRAMMQAIDPESVTASTAITGQEFRGDALRIYIVASVSGGTGSGAVLDMAYAVRAMLKKLTASEINITGIMLHSTGRDPRHCELARVNSYSWFTEYHHFHQSDTAYPGDASCGLPPHELGVSVFDNSYFVHLGDALDESEFDRATRSVADYLRLDALSPAQVLFDACRNAVAGPAANTESACPETNLRSFGIHRRDAISNEVSEMAAELVGAKLFAEWQDRCTRPTPSVPQNRTSSMTSGRDPNHQPDRAPAEAVEFVQRHHLTPAGLAAQARVLVEAQLGSDAESFLSNWLSQRLSASQASDDARWEAVDDVFGIGSSIAGTEAKPTLLGQPLEDIVQPLAEQLGGDVRRWVIQRLDPPNDGAAGVWPIAHFLRHHFESMLAAVERHRGPLSTTLRELRRSAPPTNAYSAPMAANATADVARLSHYFELRLDDLALRAAEYVARRVLAELTAVGDDLTVFGRELVQIAAAAASRPNEKRGSHATNGVDSQEPNCLNALEAVRSNLNDLTVAVDARLHRDFLYEQGGLFQVVMQGGRPRAQLSAKVQEFARHAIEVLLCASNSRSEAFGNRDQHGSADAAWREHIQSATPAMLEHGGAWRALAILARGSSRQFGGDQLAEAAGTTISAIEGYDSSLTLCVEAEHLSLKRVAVSLIERRRDSAEFAKRVHSRSDIAWSPLIAPPAEPVDAIASGITTVSMAMDPSGRQTEVV